MKNITDRVSNPFDQQPPCSYRCNGAGDDRRAVYSYGDANAGYHIIGDYPGVHGGATTGIPFTDSPADRILDILEKTGFLEWEASTPRLSNCFLSYRYCCCLPEGEAPTPEEYAALDPFFDAELRAITADVLLPIGERTTRHVITEYTAQAHRIEFDMVACTPRKFEDKGFLSSQFVTRHCGTTMTPTVLSR
jgi:uracil-DNA glycosylase